jgi:hypothetical protein
VLLNNATFGPSGEDTPLRNGFDFVDIEPVLIKYYKDKQEHSWIHPEAANICDFTAESDAIRASDVHRVYLADDKGNTIYIVFKSEYMDNFVSGMYNEETDEYNYPYQLGEEEWESFMGMLYVMLVEDVWTPGCEQFCFSDFAEKLYEYIDLENAHVDFLSSDVSLYFDGEWGFES